MPECFSESIFKEMLNELHLNNFLISKVKYRQVSIKKIRAIYKMETLKDGMAIAQLSLIFILSRKIYLFLNKIWCL